MPLAKKIQISCTGSKVPFWQFFNQKWPFFWPSKNLYKQCVSLRYFELKYIRKIGLCLNWENIFTWEVYDVQQTSCSYTVIQWVEINSEIAASFSYHFHETLAEAICFSYLNSEEKIEKQMVLMVFLVGRKSRWLQLLIPNSVNTQYMTNSTLVSPVKMEYG